MEQELRNLVFISGNKNKIAEVEKQFKKYNIKILPKEIDIKELQEASPLNLVRDKAIKAFDKVKNEFIVEHTELRIDFLNGFPGINTAPFWKTLGSKKICLLCQGSKAQAITYIGYCDGKKIEVFSGTTNGIIASEPKGETDFQWDCIFIPVGSQKTFAELGNKKEKYSMRKKAIKQFMEWYNGRTKKKN